MRAVAAAIAAAIAALGLAACAGDEADVATVPPTVSSTIPDEAGGSAGNTDGDSSTCSAGELQGPTYSEQDLADEVEIVRRQIFDAAARCAYTELESIATTGGGEFTYSFGGLEGSFASFLRDQEDAAGPDSDEVLPTEALVLLLNTAYGSQEVDGKQLFVWPSAAAADSWAQVNDAERDALVPPYTQQDLEGFDDAGSYLGWRVGIDEDGIWRFFVAGD